MTRPSKPLASLSSVLVRKGHAKPAMRLHGLVGPSVPPVSSEDLGRNDMGPPTAEVPPVLVQRAALREELAATAAPGVKKPAAVTASRVACDTPQERAANTNGKAAFTVLLDEDRQLRLRRASARCNASAQTLIVAALDRFLQSPPDVEDLVRQLPAGAKS